MKILMHLLFLFFICQQQLLAQPDTPVVLRPAAFIQQVKLYHPVAKQAGLQVDRANAALLASRGSFDPVLQTESSRKTFDGKNYYFYNNPELKVQTAAGFVLKAGLENNGGENLTTETTRGRTSYLGAELPLAKGLLLDKQRAALQQAKIFVALSEQERLTAINDLLFEAYTDYYQWAAAFQLYHLYERYITTAAERLRLVRSAWQNGDRSVMDTVEAFTQLQQYSLQQLTALQQLNETAITLSAYLWLPNEKPYLLPAQYLPDTTALSTILTPPTMKWLIDQSATEHPAIRAYEKKINSLEVEKRLKFQGLLPELNLRANLLNKDYYALKGLDAALLENNYKWGISFKMPLFIREGRGGYRQAVLKVKETNLQLSNKRWQIATKIRSYYNDNNMLLQQLNTTQQLFNNYTLLLRNEELKFRQGESSLFLVNTREIKLVELQQKQVELRAKFIKSVYAITWAAGLLALQ